MFIRHDFSFLSMAYSRNTAKIKEINLFNGICISVKYIKSQFESEAVAGSLFFFHFSNVIKLKIMKLLE